MIKFPSYFIGFSSKADGSASLRFATQEIAAEEFAELKRHHNAFGWLVFAEKEADAEIPDEDIEEEGISSSERLRRRLFVFWKHPKGKNGEGDFETWRKQYIETIGEKLLERLQ